jgi:hypothetical protein
MAQPTTAKFGKFIVMLGTPGGPIPPSPITAITNTADAVVTVGATEITKYTVGMVVTIAAVVAAGFTGINGPQTISSINSSTGTFTTGFDASGAGAAAGSGGTAQAPGTVITYAAPCGFTSKSFTLTKNLQEIDIPDCDNPDAVAWVGRDAQNLSAVITGDGVAAAESVPTWNDAWQSVDSVPAQIEIEFSTGTLTYTGLFQVDELAFTAEQAARVTLAVNMQSDGEVVDTWTPTP